jgi:cell division protein ZapA
MPALNLAFDVSDRNVPSFQASGFAHSELPADGNDAHDPRLASLVNWLDAALGDDGRLL